jgi:hypothetical protein
MMELEAAEMLRPAPILRKMRDLPQERMGGRAERESLRLIERGVSARVVNLKQVLLKPVVGFRHPLEDKALSRRPFEIGLGGIRRGVMYSL